MSLILARARASTHIIPARSLINRVHTALPLPSAVIGAPDDHKDLKCGGLEVLENARQVEGMEPRRPSNGGQLSFPSWQHWNQDELLMSRCESGKKLKVALLLSGGVDSSVALALLKAAGHDIEAFYLQIWFQEDFRNFWDACPWETDLEYAKQVCEMFDVPMKVIPFTNEYWERVVSDCIKEIKAGRTPNPDILCNSRVKFGAFYDFLESSGCIFDRIASGHYANVSNSENGLSTMSLSPDAVKDQTYFLASLSQRQLNTTLFPLGSLRKEQVRMLASAAHLPTQTRKDSQGICFLGKVKFNEFVKQHLGEWHGLIVEEETNTVVGIHEGYWFYTVGQRKGLQLPGGPWYVSGKNIDWNIVYASQDYSSVDKTRNSFYCNSMKWLQQPSIQIPLFCKVRHGPEMYGCKIDSIGEDEFKVELDGRDQGLAPGQYAVFYQNQVCLGCGIIALSPSADTLDTV